MIFNYFSELAIFDSSKKIILIVLQKKLNNINANKYKQQDLIFLKTIKRKIFLFFLHNTINFIWKETNKYHFLLLISIGIIFVSKETNNSKLNLKLYILSIVLTIEMNSLKRFLICDIWIH